MRVVSLGLVLLFACSETTLASTAQLYSGCTYVVAIYDGRAVPKDDQTTHDMAYCLGWIQGMRQMSDYWNDKEDSPELKFDVPQNVSIGQLIRIFVGFLDEFPEARNKNEVSVYLAVMGASFPRQNGEQRQTNP